MSEKLETRNKRRKLTLIVCIGILLFSPMIGIVPLAQASSTLEIFDWWVFPDPSKTYEDMIMRIQIHNKDSIEHTYNLYLSAIYEGIYKGWSGSILSVDGIIKAGDYVSVPIVLTPTDVPYGGRVKFELSLISENPNPPPYYAEVDEETKWVTIEKGELETNVDNLMQYYDALNSTIDLHELKLFLLNSTGISLNASYVDIGNKYNSLKNELKNTKDELANTKNMVYVTLVMLIVFGATTVYFARRKPT